MRHRRHGLRQQFAHPVGESHDSGCVFERLFCLDDVERRDLRDSIRTVLFGHVPLDVIPSTGREIDIKVGHRFTFRIEETLEQQSVLNRIKVGDSHRERGERSGARTSARSNANTVLTGPPDEVRNDQVITGETFRIDDLNFVGRTLFDFRRESVGVTECESSANLAFKGCGFGVPRFDREVRHMVRARIEFDIAAFGDEQRVVRRLGVVREQ